MRYFITAIDTNIGKTIVSSVLVQKLGYDYWKPIQSGLDYPTDTQRVQSLVSNKEIHFFEESYRLKSPLSPHESAKIDGIQIKLNTITCPSSNKLIIEGAGGVFVPLNDNGDLMIDIIKKMNCEIIIVAKNYLGSINHTLLTCEALLLKNIPIKGLVYIGEANKASESIIEKITSIKTIGHLPKLSKIDTKAVQQLCDCISI